MFGRHLIDVEKRLVRVNSLLPLMLRTLALALVVTFGASACTYMGDNNNPLMRKLAWYSYIGGEDIRDNCGMGQGNSARLVYNAIHTEQVRTYDISQQGFDGPSTMDVRVLGPSSLGKLSDSGMDDLLSPWRGDTATTTLRPQDSQQLWKVMEISGVFGPAPEGLHLISEKFFWLTAVCHDGRFFYNAFLWPSDRFENKQFSNLVFAWDMTGIPVNPPRQATMFDIYGDASPKKKTGPYYQVTIGKNGLK